MPAIFQPSFCLPLRKFSLGRLRATSGVTAFAQQHDIDLDQLVGRHACGDDGDLCEGDKTYNKEALRSGWRITSCYRYPKRSPESTLSTNQIPAVEIWIMTEADRANTTVLLSSEY